MKYLGKITDDKDLVTKEYVDDAVSTASGDPPSSTTPLAPGTASAGSENAYARGDHVHPLQAVPSATSTTPKMDGTAAVGSETTFAKGDHVHPTDTSRAPTGHASTATTYGLGNASNYGHVKLTDTYSGTNAASTGIAPSQKALKNGLDAYKALCEMNDPAMILFEQSGTWTPPTGCTKAIAILCGGGGYGGSGYSSSAAGGGGGGGGSGYMKMQEITFTAGTALTITVGAGGKVPTTGSRTNAGASSIKQGSTTLVTANGGGNGADATSGKGGAGGAGMAGGGGGCGATSGGKGGAGSVYGGGGGGGYGSGTSGVGGVGGAGGKYGGGGGGGRSGTSSTSATRIAGGAKGTYGGAGGAGAVVGPGLKSTAAGNGSVFVHRIPPVFSLLGVVALDAQSLAGTNNTSYSLGGPGGAGYGSRGADNRNSTRNCYGGGGGGGFGGWGGHGAGYPNSYIYGPYQAYTKPGDLCASGGTGGGGFFSPRVVLEQPNADYAGGGGGGLFYKNYGHGGNGHEKGPYTDYVSSNMQGSNGVVILFVPNLNNVHQAT